MLRFRGLKISPSRIPTVLIVLLLVAQMAFGVNAVAAAGPKATLTWNFTSVQVNESTPLGATFSYSGLPRGAKLIFERQFGTAKVMRAVARYTVSGAGSENVTLPAVPMGSFGYRVIATRSNGVIILKTPVKNLFSYGTVPLSTLCNFPKANFDEGCSSGAEQVGSNLFVYNMIGDYGGYRPPQYGTLVSFPANDCRTLTLNFALGTTPRLAKVPTFKSFRRHWIQK